MVAFVCRMCVVGLKESVGSVLTASLSIPTMGQNELLLFLVFKNRMVSEQCCCSRSLKSR